jgi:hypothetical protein
MLLVDHKVGEKRKGSEKEKFFLGIFFLPFPNPFDRTKSHRGRGFALFRTSTSYHMLGGERLAVSGQGYESSRSRYPGHTSR